MGEDCSVEEKKRGSSMTVANKVEGPTSNHTEISITASQDHFLPLSKGGRKERGVIIWKKPSRGAALKLRRWAMRRDKSGCLFL